MKWNVYGISGLWLDIDGNSQQCGPSGTSGGEIALSGSGTLSLHISDFNYGGYILHLKVLRNDGQVVYHNEKFMCIGNFTSPPPAPTAKPTSKP